jgi:hypothetical protein
VTLDNLLFRADRIVEEGYPQWSHVEIELATALKAMLPVIMAAKTWERFGRDDGDDERDLLTAARACLATLRLVGTTKEGV